MSDTNQRARPRRADYPCTADGYVLFTAALIPWQYKEIERLHDISNDWHKVADARALEILRLTDETADQARLLGMSGEREAGLRSEIERLQRTVTEMEIVARVKDNADLASRDLAELRPCYSIDGLTAFIAKHFPQMELRARADTEQPTASKPNKFDLAFEIMRQLESENMQAMQSCQFGYVMRITREGTPSTLSKIPSAWYRGVQIAGPPDDPEEYDVEMSYGDERPDGNGWIPLYRRSASHGQGCEPHECDDGRLIQGAACNECGGSGIASDE